jgi:hypothetical protein
LYPYQNGRPEQPLQWAPPGMLPPQYQPPVPSPAARKRRRWPWVLGALFFLVFVVPALSNRDSSVPTSTTPTARPSAAAAPALPLAAAPGTAQKAAPAAPVASSGPATSFGDGTWVVGEDVMAGTYKSSGARPGVFEFCSVSTLAGDTSDSDVLDWSTARADEPVRIRLDGKVKAVKASGCEDFTKVG